VEGSVNPEYPHEIGENMNDTYFNLPLNSPRLAVEGLTLVQSMREVDPVAWLRGLERLRLLNTDEAHYLEQTSVRPACVTLKDPFAGSLILLSGTQGTLHTSQLIGGWNNPGGSVRASGANPAFENAALNILEELPASAINREAPIRIFGYSYGGATGQVLADELFNNLRARYVGCCSFGSPRPGNVDFQRRMERIPNVRWFCDNDPVRFMPPHVTEVPSALYFLAPSLWRGMDTQVQCRVGFQLEADGNISQTEGEPTVLHAVVPSILNWITDTNGFRSLNHAPENYLRRLALNIQEGGQVERPVVTDAPEQPAVISPADREWLLRQAELDVIASPELTVPPGGTITVTVLDRATPSRYRRKKQGRVWTVQLDGVIVAVGPGKRRAGQIARVMNRAALL